MMCGFAPRPSTDETFTIEPPPAASSAGAAARMPRKGPIWLTRTCRSKSASVVSSSGFICRMAALFTSTVSGPKRACVRSMARVQSASEPTSRRTKAAASPSSFATASPSASSTSPIITRAPSPTNSRATCSPVPRAAPVTSATFPSRRPTSTPLLLPGTSEQDRVEREHARADQQEHEADHGEVDGVLRAGRVVRDQVAGALVPEHAGHGHRADQQQAGRTREQAEREAAAADQLREHRDARLHPRMGHAEAAQPVREPCHVAGADETELAERVDHEAAADRDPPDEDGEVDEAAGAAGEQGSEIHGPSREAPLGTRKCGGAGGLPGALLPGEARGPLLEKGGDALLVVRGGEALAERLGVRADVLALRPLEAAVDQLLDAPLRERRAGEEAPRQLVRRGQARLGRDDAQHVAERERLLGLDEAPRVEQLERARRPEQARQQPAAGPGVGHEAALREVPCEARARRGDADVALARELGAHADRDAVDGGDHRFRARDERPP